MLQCSDEAFARPVPCLGQSLQKQPPPAQSETLVHSRVAVRILLKVTQLEDPIPDLLHMSAPAPGCRGRADWQLHCRIEAKASQSACYSAARCGLSGSCMLLRCFIPCWAGGVRALQQTP
jgi:hypothetical protein